MKRYVQLIIGGLLVGAGITGLNLTWGRAEAYAQTKTQMPGGLAFAVLGSLLSILAGAILLGIYGSRTWRVRRRAHGHFTRSERDALNRQQRQEAAAAKAWEDAAALAADLAVKHLPGPLQVWGLVLREDEVAYLSTQAFYARWYGGDGSYVHVDGLFVGNASFVATGYALTALGNKMHRDLARANAMHQWREHQEVGVVVTSQRITCNVGRAHATVWAHRPADSSSCRMGPVRRARACRASGTGCAPERSPW